MACDACQGEESVNHSFYPLYVLASILSTPSLAAFFFTLPTGIPRVTAFFWHFPHHGRPGIPRRSEIRKSVPGRSSYALGKMAAPMDRPEGPQSGEWTKKREVSFVMKGPTYDA